MNVLDRNLQLLGDRQQIHVLRTGTCVDYSPRSGPAALCLGSAATAPLSFPQPAAQDAHEHADSSKPPGISGRPIPPHARQE